MTDQAVLDDAPPVPTAATVPAGPPEPLRVHPHAQYRLALTAEDLQELAAELHQACIEGRLIGFDTETSGLDLYGDKAGRVVGLCFSTRAHTGWYVPIGHEVADGVLDPRQFDAATVIDYLRPYMEGTAGLLEGQEPRHLLVGFNAKFDLKHMAMLGVTCRFAHDGLIQASLSGKYMPGQRGLKNMVTTHLRGPNGERIEPLEIHEVQAAQDPDGKKPKKTEIAFHKNDIYESLNYAAADADHTLQLHPILHAEMLQTLGGIDFVYSQIEMPLMPVVAAMEMAGVPTDVDFLRDRAVTAVRMKNRIEDATKKVIFDLAGEEWNLNINSVKQIGELFTERLADHVTIPNEPGTGEPKRTGTGNLSFDGSVLEEMAKTAPWIHGIITYKSILKLHGSFLKKMGEQAIDGRIYANFNQVGTETGRFSSSGPNMQQIPKNQHFFVELMNDELWEAYAEFNTMDAETFRQHVWDKLHAEDVSRPSDVPTWTADDGTMFSLRVEKVADENGHEVDRETVWESWVCRTRNSIKAKPGSYIVEADYSQIELRVFAGETQEPNLLQAFNTGEDVHTRTASVVFGVPADQVSKKQRGSAKTINFGIIYGATAKRISESEGIPFREAEILVRNYFAALPKAQKWIEDMKKKIVLEKSARTKYGRVRSFDRLLGFGRNAGPGPVAMAEREGVNAIIQGTAADIMKFALINLNRHLAARFGDDARLVMTVHDSIVLEVKDTVPVKDIVDAVYACMVFDIPDYPVIDIDVQIGTSWGEGTEVERGEEYETPSATNDIAKPPVQWVLEVLEVITVEQQNNLLEFLQSRQSSESVAKLIVRFHREGREPDERSSQHGYQLDFRDRPYIRRLIGDCNLHQALDAVDADKVLADLNDDSVMGN